jgi:UPF0716 protein FxsA
LALPSRKATFLRLFPIPLLIIVYVLAEIACLVVIGGQIGVLAIIGVIIATALLGSILLRIQGFGTLARIRNEMDAGRVPSRDLAHGVMILAAGLLLMIPGFISDAAGLLLFIPAFRDLGWSVLRQRFRVVTNASGGRFAWRGARQPRTVDLKSEDYSRDGERDPRQLPERD